MNDAIYAVYGASGYGREVMPLAHAQLNKVGIPKENLVFIDDNLAASVVNGYPVLTYAEFLARPAGARRVVVAIGDGGVREKITERFHADGVVAWSVSAQNVVVMDNVVLGEGSILNPFVTLTSNILIGMQFHANIYSYVAHDCVIGDYVTFASAVKCNGNVHIKDHAYIGTGAILKQGQAGRPLVIGEGAIVGMGAVVTKDVQAGSVVIGNPAKPMVLEK